MNILLVDDNIPVIRGMKQNIDWKTLHVDKVFLAVSMKEAIRFFEAEKVEILISDIQMPGGSGLDLIDWIRNRNLNCICIILSSYPDFKYAQRAVSLGVMEYLLKPVESHLLEQTIRRAVERYDEKTDRSDRGPEKRYSEVVQKVRQYVAGHLSEEIGRKQLADWIGFNPEYLSTIFKKEMNCTLSEYIRRERLSMARKLLSKTNLSISLIAQNCGFETLSYFSNVFRQEEGVSPREYRRQSFEAEEDL